MTNVKTQLLAGEAIVWEGRPYHGLVFRPIDVFLVPFSLFWAGFAIFWNADVWKGDADLSFRLFGLPFLLAGLYVTAGRFLIDMFIRRGTSYYVTNRRIIIARRLKLTSLDIKRLPSLELDERSDGSGTIRFGASSGLLSGANNFGIWQPTSDPTPQFIRVEYVHSVYDLIQKQAAG